MSITLPTFHLILNRFSPNKKFLIAYSGGLDSHVLLHLCAEIKRVDGTPSFSAIHVHHGLQNDADQWSSHCTTVCEAINIPFQLRRINALPKPGESPEEAARNARYGVLKELVSEGDILLTAHHRDDQAESILLQLFRGAGPSGLSGMPEQATFSDGLIARPLLEFSQQSLNDYAIEHGLCWIEDRSNEDLSYDRNFLRHQVIPVLAERWPSIGKTLQRSGHHCAEAESLLRELARNLFKKVHHSGRNTITIDLLIAHEKAEQRLILREWIRSSGYRMPSTAVVNRVLDEAINAKKDMNPCIDWREGEIRRYRNELYLLNLNKKFDSSFQCEWNGIDSLNLPANCGIIEPFIAAGKGISATLWKSGPITVRFRQGGETCRLAGRQGSHQLKKLFQEKGVPPWVRERIPLIYIKEQLAAIGNLWIGEPFLGEGKDSDIHLRWCENGLSWGLEGFPQQ